MNDFHPLSHFYLYSKGWYKRSDNVIDDLKKIIAHTFDYDVELANVNDIVQVLLREVHHTVFSKSEPEFVDFITDLRIGFNSEKFNLDEAIIWHCLSLMSILKLTDDKGNQIVFFEAPNENVLPLKSETSLKRWEEMKNRLANKSVA